MRQESGFTLIELVVVIVILGILAAFAVPRFVGMQDEARSSTLKGLTGSMRGAASLGHAKVLANQTSPDPNDPYDVSIQGQNVDFAANSTWPAATQAGIEDLLQDTSGFAVASGCRNASSSCITYFPEGVTNNATCYTTYHMNDTLGAPNFYTVTSDCS